MNFEAQYRTLREQLLLADEVDVGEWQAQRHANGMTRTAELEDVKIEYEIPISVDLLAKQIQPNRAWADEHFAERVGGHPVNPPPSHERWPYARKSNEEHRPGGVFSHTYPERMWPRFAKAGLGGGMQGIRFRYGDLLDAVKVLRERPQTRQVYIPIWFPEDLAASMAGERVPCTLGYHVMIRRGQLSIRYYMRSCDFLRHLRDDVYLACRLAQWLCAQLETWVAVRPGRLVMHITSLHVFMPNDRYILINQRRREEVSASPE